MMMQEKQYEEALDEYFKEWSRAEDRMLHGWSFSESVIIWALDFLEIKLEQISPIEWRQLQYEIDVIARFGPREQMAVAGGWPKHALYDLAAPSPADIILERLPSQDTVKRLQTQVKEHVQNIVATKKTHLTLPASTSLAYHFVTAVPPRHAHPGYRLAQEGPRQEKEFFVSRFLVASLPIAFQYHILEAMYLHPGRIRHCQACCSLFFAERKHREYCSDQCRARTNMRAKRRTAPDRYGKRGPRPSEPGTTGKMKKKGRTTVSAKAVATRAQGARHPR